MKKILIFIWVFMLLVDFSKAETNQINVRPSRLFEPNQEIFQNIIFSIAGTNCLKNGMTNAIRCRLENLSTNTIDYIIPGSSSGMLSIYLVDSSGNEYILDESPKTPTNNIMGAGVPAMTLGSIQAGKEKIWLVPINIKAGKIPLGEYRLFVEQFAVFPRTKYGQPFEASLKVRIVE